MKVLMAPHIYQLGEARNDGISQVITAYFKHLPQFGIELVVPDATDYDIRATHAGTQGNLADVSHLHGLYWTADYAADHWQYRANQRIVESLRHAKTVTVPSRWVAETLQRDMHISPVVIPHGIDTTDWLPPDEIGDYVLWNKNRRYDVCDPRPIYELAMRFGNGRFITTFMPDKVVPPQNLQAIGTVDHNAMRSIVQHSLIYLATTKETFGIGTLEALACGVPVLGFAHGATPEIVVHGETGYLAQPHNYEDLAQGLAFCTQHRDVLSANARESAKQWTWEAACSLVADTYTRTLENLALDDGQVSVIIPVYNKTPAQLMRAVASALDQTKRPAIVIVVDDGSDPELSHQYKTVLDKTDAIYFHKLNGGVATARNYGIEACNTQYVCCLDADDAIEPDFLQVCCNALDADRALGMAYTKLRMVGPEGQDGGTAQWPDGFDYAKQLKRGNQVPTCCVFRRVAWQRSGGYRQRYAPDGAGAEDGEFWLRLGALGFSGRLVTQKPLFVYSVGSGYVSGNRNYREVDWTVWHPWTKDGQHPLASVAEPSYLSHPVRQYDQPVVSVVIPVGPGHGETLANALDSLEAQTMRRWEAIVVFDCLVLDSEFEYLSQAYPFVRWAWTQYDSPGYTSRGAGYARNRGAELARAPFLVFLDADDWLHPEYLAKTLAAYENGEPAIIYTDYVGRAVITNPQDLAPDLRERIYVLRDDGQESILGFRAAEYDCERAQRQPEGENPWTWTNVTALIPTVWHREIGGFNEEMPSWEDALYHYRLARRGHCYRRLPEELYVYCLSRGSRRENGRQDYNNLLQWISRELEKETVMACSNCPKHTSTRPASLPAPLPQMTTTLTEEDSFVMCTYNGRNRGDHPVYGGATFAYPLPSVSMINTRDGYRINYGQRPGGGQARFPVHSRDIRLQPEIFVPVTTPTIVPQMPQAPLPQAPVPQRAPVPQEVQAPQFAPTPVPQQQTPAPAVLEMVIAGETEQVAVPNQTAPAQELADLQKIAGVGPALASQLYERGVTSLGKVLTAHAAGVLTEIPGVSVAKAALIARSAKMVLDRAENENAASRRPLVTDGSETSNGEPDE